MEASKLGQLLAGNGAVRTEVVPEYQSRLSQPEGWPATTVGLAFTIPGTDDCSVSPCSPALLGANA